MRPYRFRFEDPDTFRAHVRRRMRLVDEYLFRSARDTSGSVTVVTAVLVPVIIIASFGCVSLQVVLSKRQELQDIVDLACMRAMQPTRMQILTDDDRKLAAQAMIARMTAERGFADVAYSMAVDWTEAKVTASAKIPALENIVLVAKDYTVGASSNCSSLPPYPAKGDAIMTSNFTRPDGTSLPMKYGVWGIYKAKEFGWEGGTGPGVEIQDWNDPKVFGQLPPGSSSRYVVELDSDANSSMYRTVELHRGTYRFSFWYFARMPSAETNRISVYLEGVRPVSPSVRKLSVAKAGDGTWTYEQFTLTVDAYSLYKLTIAAEGDSDSYGGNFNNLKLEYIGRPGEHVS